MSSIGAAALLNWCGTIIVPKENRWFCKDGGALFTIDKKTILKVPYEYGEECVIPEGVETIAAGVFVDRYDISSVVLPESLKTIEDMAFCNCAELKTIRIPAGVTTIGAEAFGGTPVAFEVDANNKNYASLDGVLFSKDMTTLYCGGGVTKSDYTIPNGVEAVAVDAFWGCQTLQKVTVPEGVKSIRTMAFYGCSNLVSVTLPVSITKIGQMTFGDCSALTDIYYTGTEEQWKAIPVGYGNDALTSATIHFNSAPTGNSAVTAGATVKVTTADGGTQEVSAVDGTYSFASLPAGTYTICVEKTGYVSYKTEFVYTGVNRPPDVTLVKRGDINGAPSDTGDVDAADMQCLFELLATGAYSGSIKDEAYRNAVADVNSDGVVDILDYQALYMHITAGRCVGSAG